MKIRLIAASGLKEPELIERLKQPDNNYSGNHIEDSEFLTTFCARVSSPHQESLEIEKLIRYCFTAGHVSIFEMANFVFEIETTRMISPQILRHRSFSFQEFSQRYAAVTGEGIEIYVARRQDKKNRQNSVDDLSPEIKAEWEARQVENWKRSFEHYTWALDNNIAKECARAVLPLQTTTRLYMNGTLRSWLHYLQTRCGNGTQLEHMDIALAIRERLAQELPTIARAVGWVEAGSQSQNL